MRRLFMQHLVILLVLPCLLLGFTLSPLHAEMISTADAVSITGDTPYTRVAAFIERQDVQQIMARQGVDVQDARERLQALSDRELLAIANQLEKLPAGGDGFGAVIGGVIFIFIVLLITDILGFTHVFPFVNR
ncbi:MAG: PA2779 family protein [Desulfobulbaceae bacterium]|nr:PA2779 family protein [Desulfobulbaceae bacterium]